jgi:hypothetical protein
MLEGVDLCLAQNSVKWARLTDGCTIASMSVNVWEHQPGESAKAHEAFRSYLALAENRSCTKVAQQLHKAGR